MYIVCTFICIVCSVYVLCTGFALCVAATRSFKRPGGAMQQTGQLNCQQWFYWKRRGHHADHARMIFYIFYEPIINPVWPWKSVSQVFYHVCCTLIAHVFDLSLIFQAKGGMFIAHLARWLQYFCCLASTARTTLVLNHCRTSQTTNTKHVEEIGV